MGGHAGHAAIPLASATEGFEHRCHYPILGCDPSTYCRLWVVILSIIGLAFLGWLLSPVGNYGILWKLGVGDFATQAHPSAQDLQQTQELEDLCERYARLQAEHAALKARRKLVRHEAPPCKPTTIPKPRTGGNVPWLQRERFYTTDPKRLTAFQRCVRARASASIRVYPFVFGCAFVCIYLPLFLGTRQDVHLRWILECLDSRPF